MTRFALLVAALAACRPAPSTPPSAPGPASAATRSDASAEAAAPEPTPAEPAAIDPTAVLAEGGPLFIHRRDGCEAWAVTDDGRRLQAILDDEGPPLSFAIRASSQSITLDDPRVGAADLTVQPACEPVRRDGNTLYASESDCQAGLRPLPLVDSCVAALADDDARATVLAALEAQRAAELAARRAAAPDLLAGLRRALKRHGGVWWRSPSDDPTIDPCPRWRVHGDRLVHRVGKGRSSYRLQLQIDRRTSLAQVSLTGPDFEGPDGRGGVGDWQLLPIREVTAARALVGDEHWYFSEKACRDSLAPASSSDQGLAQ